MRSEGDTDDDASELRDEETVDRTIGKYSLTRVIGRGGMGLVYEAQNTAIGKRVAIKLIGKDLAKNKDAVKRFQREAQAASAVESAHIVDIFDAGTADDGTPYIVMELLRGEDLGHRIKRLGRLELDETLHITVQILRGLARAHAAGIVHRDLKPDNIFLVDRDDDPTFVKILDFGISKVARTGETPVQTLTKQGTVLGTPFYMSPEQAQGFADTDGRADLWSVGAIVYECLTGRAPHMGASYEQVIVSICTKDADDVRVHNPAVPEDFARVIARALARDRDERFGSARELLEAVAAASGGAVTLVPRSSDEPSGSAGSGRRPLASSPSSGPLKDSGGVARVGTSAYDETVEVMKGGGPSRVGWSTSGRSAARRDRRRMLVIAGGAIAIGVAAAAAVLLRPPAETGPGPGGPSPAIAATGEVTVRLRANVVSARFLVDGKPVADGVIRGRRGETKRVRIEADGYTPVEALVPLDPDAALPEVILSPSAGAAVSAEPSVEVTPKSTTKAAGGKAPPLPPLTATALTTALPTAIPTQTPTAAHTATPAPTPTLTIKRD